MRVHQMTAALVYGDAITNHILEIDGRLKAWGFDSRIYAEHIEASMQKAGQPDGEYEPFLGKRDDLLIYHYSVYAANLDLYRRSRNRKIVIYHNITPAEFFRGYDRGLEAACRAGRWALSDLRDCDLALADSDFNRRELVAAGIPAERTGVLPIFFNLGNLANAERNAALYRRLKDGGGTNLLFVGRIVPNKGYEDLIKIFYCYRQYIDRQAHLWLVGFSFLPVYRRFLDALVERLGLAKAVVFAGRVSAADLRTYYEAADVFLCASRHEGFGVPLLESMHFGLPILALNSAAVPDTLGPAGVLFNQLSYGEIAETAHLLIADADLRREIILRQRQRLADFDAERVEDRLRQVLVQVGVLP